MRRLILAFVVATLLAASAVTDTLPADPAVPDILSLRVQPDLRDDWLVKRLDTLLPKLMERASVDMWIVIAREYTEDPVVDTLLPATWLSARRRTVLIIHQPEHRVVDRTQRAERPSPNGGSWCASGSKRMHTLTARLSSSSTAARLAIT